MWPFGDSSSPSEEAPSQFELSNPNNSASFDDHTVFQASDSDIAKELHAPIIALDHLKRAGVPLDRQISPYLQMDPRVFQESTPQYILPAGESKGELEFAMGRIGWAVLGGFSVGSLRGVLPELRNPETRQLPFKPFVTRLMNASVKHGSGFAQPAGSIVFMFSVTEMLLGKVRARDDLNAIGAGAITGAIFRSIHGMRASVVGAGVGLVAAVAWLLSDRDSRHRLGEMSNQVFSRDYDL